MVQKQSRVPLFAKQCARIIFNTHISFFDNHITFGENVRFVEVEIDHTIRFHFHHQLEPIGGDALVIRRIVVTGESIV